MDSPTDRPRDTPRDTPADAPRDITRLLASARDGDPASMNQVFAMVYEELWNIARRERRRLGPEQTLNTTAVVHEAYLRLANIAEVPWKDRCHFFSVASLAMRQILVDYARSRRAQKRGGDAVRVTLDNVDAAVESRVDEVLEIDAALEKLAAVDAPLARIVEMRFFGGLTVDEIAELLGTPKRTLERDWQKAKAFLYRVLKCD
ncbi:MAG: sigma-70 family RNA polymerase sigma factor [bacterium]